MPDLFANREDLIALLADLRRRGVTFVLVGNRLKIRPWRTLTADEADTVQANRPTLKALIREDGDVPNVTDVPTSAETRAATAFVDRDALLKARDIGAWLVIHANEPEAIEYRRKAATAEMMKMLRFGVPNYWREGTA